MIEWKPIEDAPSTQVLLYIPPLKLREAVVFIGRADECRRSATHWAPINLPWEPVRTCKNEITGLCIGCKDHNRWVAADNAKK